MLKIRKNAIGKTSILLLGNLNKLLNKDSKFIFKI